MALDFRPALDLAEWVRHNIIGNGPLHNPDHEHLAAASIGFVWTNVPCRKQGRDVAGQCEMPMVEGTWGKARIGYLLTQWFGRIPDFVITINANYADQSGDAAFCALVEHELYHAGQALDDFGSPKFNKMGDPIFAMRGHDCEEFVGVVARYGAGNAAGGTSLLVHAAQFEPSVAEANIRAACGTCLRV